MAGDRKGLPDCVNASNPFHVCADYCLQRSPNPKLNIHGAQSPFRNGMIVDPDCVNASNPFHQCADYCTKTKKESETGKSGRFALPVFKLSPRSPSLSGGSYGGKSDQNREGVGEDRRSIDPNCINASNPFHKCGDCCTKKTVDTRKRSGKGKEVQNGESLKREVRKMEEGTKVDLMHVHLSDPFHQRSECCSHRIAEDRKSVTLEALLARESEEELASRKNSEVEAVSRGNKKALLARESEEELASRKNSEVEAVSRGNKKALLARESEEELASRKNSKVEAVSRGNKKVDPRCPNALNPFHECAEYCVQKIGESGRSVGCKSDRSKGSRSGRSEGGKSGISKGSSNIVMDKTDVNPRCVNASNPFHKCAEYCIERIQESA